MSEKRYPYSPLKYYKMDSSVKNPVFATEGSACFDLHAWIPDGIEVARYTSWGDFSFVKISSDESVIVGQQDRLLIPTGLVFDISEGWSVRLHPRSGLALKEGLSLANQEGVIDYDYVEPVFIMITNLGHRHRTIKNGDRICQAEMVRDSKYNLVETLEKPPKKTSRDGGFGSTGESSLKPDTYGDEFLRGTDPGYPHYRESETKTSQG